MQFVNMFFTIFVAVLAIWPTSPVVSAKELGFCILPPFPKHGSYSIVVGNSTARPGDTVFSYVLKVTCNPSFQLVGPGSPSCIQGWESDDQPECIPYCLWKDTTTLSCGQHFQDTEEATCYLPPLSNPGGGSLNHHEDYSECGRVGPINVPILAGGQPAQREELPWHAGIYSKGFRPYKQICGGSLVSPKLVISAAHCFWDDKLKQLPAEDYAVAVGKIYRPWNDPNDAHAQKSDVCEIRIPPRFFGSAAHFQEDLALVVLSTAVTLTNSVRPVCLDFDYELDASQLTSGALGKVAGWGLKSEDGPASPTLQVAQIPYISIEDCIVDSPPAFHAFLSGDKICAGYTNGTAVCKGDSGGGLSFPTEDERYYLRGVVSVAPRSDHLCSVYHWATFTHLLNHQHFIQPFLDFKASREGPAPASTSMLRFADQRNYGVPTPKSNPTWV